MNNTYIVKEQGIEDEYGRLKKLNIESLETLENMVMGYIASRPSDSFESKLWTLRLKNIRARLQYKRARNKRNAKDKLYNAVRSGVALGKALAQSESRRTVSRPSTGQAALGQALETGHSSISSDELLALGYLNPKPPLSGAAKQSYLAARLEDDLALADALKSGAIVKTEQGELVPKFEDEQAKLLEQFLSGGKSDDSDSKAIS